MNCKLTNLVLRGGSNKHASATGRPTERTNERRSGRRQRSRRWPREGNLLEVTFTTTHHVQEDRTNEYLLFVCLFCLKPYIDLAATGHSFEYRNLNQNFLSSILWLFTSLAISLENLTTKNNRADTSLLVILSFYLKDFFLFLQHVICSKEKINQTNEIFHPVSFHFEQSS